MSTACWQRWPGPDGEKPRLVHRLDRDTSGVLVLAKTRKAASDLGAIFRTRSARKIYWALVRGVPSPKQGRISLFLSKQMGRDGERVRVMKHGDEEAVHSVTFYSLVDRAASAVSWLSLKPVTGRTHQLRAHAAHIGHPIIGDPKYGEAWEGMPEGLPDKLHLHARRITLPHPRGGMLDVTAPLPAHMRHELRHARLRHLVLRPHRRRAGGLSGWLGTTCPSGSTSKPRSRSATARSS